MRQHIGTKPSNGDWHIFVVTDVSAFYWLLICKDEPQVIKIPN